MRKIRAQESKQKQLAADFTKLLQTKLSDSINLHVNLYSSCLNPSEIRNSLALALGMLYCDVAVKADIPKEKNPFPQSWPTGMALAWIGRTMSFDSVFKNAKSWPICLSRARGPDGEPTIFRKKTAL